MGAERLPMRQITRDSATEAREGAEPAGDRPGLRRGRGDGVGVPEPRRGGPAWAGRCRRSWTTAALEARLFPDAARRAGAACRRTWPGSTRS